MFYLTTHSTHFIHGYMASEDELEVSTLVHIYDIHLSMKTLPKRHPVSSAFFFIAL